MENVNDFHEIHKRITSVLLALPAIHFEFVGVSDRNMDECPSNAENKDKRKIGELFLTFTLKNRVRPPCFVHMTGKRSVNC